MKKIIFVLFLLTLFTSLAQAETLSGNYAVKSSSVKYLVSYLIKKVTAESTGSKGKAECKGSDCEFLVGAPIKSFESKDANRDLNMLQVVKADQFPLVVVKAKTKNEITNGKMTCDLDVEFAGVKKTYKGVTFTITKSSDGFHAAGHFDLKLTNHQIERPTLLGVAIDDSVPMTIEIAWQKL